MPNFMVIGSCLLLLRAYKSRSASVSEDHSMPIARLARASDLPSLLALFDVSEVSAIAQPQERADRIWQETLAHPGVHVFVSDDRARIAATCMLVIAPNLLRGGRRHGFLENVVTHPELRGRGSWQGRGTGRTGTRMGGRLPPRADAERSSRSPRACLLRTAGFQAWPSGRLRRNATDTAQRMTPSHPRADLPNENVVPGGDLIT